MILHAQVSLLIDNYSSNNDAVPNFLPSPHCTMCCLQHVCASGQGAIECKSCEIHQALVRCRMPCTTLYKGTAQLLSLTELQLHFEGFRPEWCISNMIYSGDTPFWSETLDVMLEIHHSGREPSIYCSSISFAETIDR